MLIGEINLIRLHFSVRMGANRKFSVCLLLWRASNLFKQEICLFSNDKIWTTYEETFLMRTLCLHHSCFVICKGTTSSCNTRICGSNMSFIWSNDRNVRDSLGGNFQRDKQTSERKGDRDGCQSQRRYCSPYHTKVSSWYICLEIGLGLCTVGLAIHKVRHKGYLLIGLLTVTYIWFYKSYWTRVVYN